MYTIITTISQVWVRADSSNGFFSKFDIYTGKKKGVETGLGSRVVKELTRGLEGKNHRVFFDNFFTNAKLLEDLTHDNIFCCGPARKDRRGFPTALKTLKFKKRYWIYAFMHACTHTHTQYIHTRNAYADVCACRK